MKYLGSFLSWLVWLCWPFFCASQTNYVPLGDTTIDLSTVVVTAQFAPTESKAAVNSVRTIDRKTIESRGAANLTELLQTEANLRISNDAVLGSSLTINGLRAENLKILVDGVPVVGRLDGSIDAGQLPLSAVRQVEIIEGAQSLMYGSEASAGVVNLLTKQSQAHRFESEVTGLAESNGFSSLNARAGIGLGKISLSINGGALRFEPASADSTGRDQLWNPKEQQNARALLRFAPNESLNLRASGSFFSEKVTNLGDLRRPQFKPYAFDDYYRTERTDANLSGDGWLKNRSLYWQATAAWNRFDRRKNSYRLDIEEATQELLEGQQDTSGATGYLLRATIASDRPAKKWDFLAGLEHYTEQAEGVRIVDSTEARTGFAAATDLGVFGSLKYRISKKTTLQGGARMTHNSRFGMALTPSVWLAWHPSKAWEFKASYANGFRSPALKELYFNFIDINHYVVGNPDLQPERSHNLRMELNHQRSLGNTWQLDLQVSGFHNRVEDRIVLTEFAPVQYDYQNLADWRTTGAGLTAGVKRDWLRFRSSVVATGYFNSLSEEDGSVPSQSWSPDWVNDLTISLLEEWAGISVWHKMTGRTPYFFTENAETKEGETEGWHLLNASANGHFWDKRIRLTTGVKNLLDVRQIRSGATGIHSGGGVGTRPAHWGRSYFVQAVLFLHSKK